MNELHVPATQLLQRMGAGDPRAAEELLPLVHRELHGIAERLMQDERAGHTLQPTALVNEAWIRLVGGDPEACWESRAHFLRVAARAMRNVLVDHARARGAQKRGRRAKLDPERYLDRLANVFAERGLDVLALHEALERLDAVDAEAARIVELRFFAGLSVPEVARVLERSVSTVERTWRAARARLRRELPAPGA